MDEKTAAELEELVEKYRRLVSTQDRALYDEVFSSTRAVSLVSIRHTYLGDKGIYEDFLVGAVRASYRTIELVREELSMRLIAEDTALIIFGYHTECERRETGEPYGIAGLETQVAVREDAGGRLVHVHYSK